MNIDALFISSILKEKSAEKFRIAVKKISNDKLVGIEKNVYQFNFQPVRFSGSAMAGS